MSSQVRLAFIVTFPFFFVDHFIRPSIATWYMLRVTVHAWGESRRIGNNTEMLPTLVSHTHKMTLR